MSVLKRCEQRYIPMSKLEAVLKQFQKVLERFADVLQQEENEFIRDSAIQRFEFTFDLSWKLIKVFLAEEEGIICTSPKGCFREAYKQGLLEYDNFWLELTDIRNKTSHTYSEATAEAVYAALPQALLNFQELLKSIQGK